VHKVKPETLKSILSLVRNSDSRASAIDTSSSSIRDTTGAVGGDRPQQCVTSHTGSDDVTADDVTGEVSPRVDCEAVVDAVAVSSQRLASEDEQMRLASEGEPVAVLYRYHCIANFLFFVLTVVSCRSTFLTFHITKDKSK